MSFRNAEIRRDVAPADYHPWKGNVELQRGDPAFCVSRSELLLMLDCGQMFLAGGRNESSSSLSFGSLLDCMLLTPNLFASQYVLTPKTYESGGEEKKWSKAAKVCKEWHAANPGKEPPKTYKTPIIEKNWTKQSNTCKEWEEEKRKAGLEIITLRQRDEAAAAAAMIRKDKALVDLLEYCHTHECTQVCCTAEWVDDGTGVVVPVRILLDILIGIEEGTPIAYDLKSSQEVSLLHMERSARNYHYDVQAWMYSEVVSALFETRPVVPFGFICVRNSEPYLTATYRASEATLAQGKKKFLLAMKCYVECITTGVWPGYTKGFELI